MADSSDSLTGEMIGISVAGILAGLIFGLFGYRLFRLTLFIVSGVVFGAIAYGLLTLSSLQEWADILIACVIGIILGILCVILWQVAIFLLGVLCGALVGLIILSLIPASTFGDVSWPQYLIVGLTGLVVGVVFFFLQRPFIIIGTSLFGSYALVGGISTLADPGTLFTRVVEYFLTNQWDEIPPPTTDLWIEFGCWGGCFLGMILFQFLFSAKHCDHKKGRQAQKNTYFLILLVPQHDDYQDDQLPLLAGAEKWQAINAQNPPVAAYQYPPQYDQAPSRY